MFNSTTQKNIGLKSISAFHYTLKLVLHFWTYLKFILKIFVLSRLLISLEKTKSIVKYFIPEYEWCT